jgi:hypothetical protein
MHYNPEGVTYLPAGAVYVDGCDMLNTPPTYSETDNHPSLRPAADICGDALQPRRGAIIIAPTARFFLNPEGVAFKMFEIKRY